MYEMKTKDFYEDFSSDKKCLIAVFLQLTQNTIVIKKKISHWKNETGGVGIEEFVGLKAKTYSPLLDNSEHKKRKRRE